MSSYSYSGGDLIPWFPQRFVGRKVRVEFTNQHGTFTREGEGRGVWRDRVPYFPDVETPAFWITNWGESFIPLRQIRSIETV